MQDDRSEIVVYLLCPPVGQQEVLRVETFRHSLRLRSQVLNFTDAFRVDVFATGGK